MQNKKITTALISVYDKTGLEPIIDELVKEKVALYSTGGTELFIKGLGHPVMTVEDITGYPSILGGRVKTLHPKIFGGILNRTCLDSDQNELSTFDIPSIDLVIVDLYPFEETALSSTSEDEIIEKIDIGGIALIRAAAKNFRYVFCVSNRNDYAEFLEVFKKSNGAPDLLTRKRFSVKGFQTSSHYDTAIFNYFNKEEKCLKISIKDTNPLRYGENPHQKGIFFGALSDFFEKLNGKEISYNNLLDIDAAVHLIMEFHKGDPAFAILKHNNACGFAVRKTLPEAYKDALACDPVSAFGGVLITNKLIDLKTAEVVHSLFCEVIIAPAFSEKALTLLKMKKNRILLIQKDAELPSSSLRSCLNGVLVQDKDLKTDTCEDLNFVTDKKSNESVVEDLLFASKICKHAKSNTIVLAKNKQLLASGVGQTSRVDALHQAINKAKSFGFDLTDAVMASDAFFPFPDCVKIAHNNGIDAIVQPGGSIKDQLSIDYCNLRSMAMAFTGIRHFRH